MARIPGTFNFSANYEPRTQAPLDARMTVQFYADLTNPLTWEDFENLTWLYNGMIVSVSEDPNPNRNGIYMLLDADNYTIPSNWILSGSGLGTIINIGDGSANVYKETDASGNILLRTIKGSGAAIVTQTTDEIVIGIDASFSGEVNYGDNVGSGDVSIYAEKSGDELRFRTIKAGQGIDLSYSDANTIQIDVSGGIDGSIYTSQVLYDPSLNPALTMPSPVGGIPAGTSVADLDGDSVKQILNDMLFPTVDPVLSNPNNSFSRNPATSFYEVNDTASFSFTNTLDQGSITVSGSFQNFRSGPANAFFYTDPSGNAYGPFDVSTSISPNIQTPGTYKIILGIQSWTGRVSYDAGPQPLDSKGNPFGSPLPAGTTSPKTISLEGVYPIFATTSDINTLTKQSLISMSTSVSPGYTLAAETGGAKGQFEIADKWTGSPNNNPLTGVQTFNAFSSTWEYQGGSAAASLTSWTTTPTTQLIQGVSENYTLYTYNGVDRGSIQIRLVF